MITGYTREAGVRQLEREIGKLARKVARRIAAGEVARSTVNRPRLVDELLGRPKVHPERGRREDQVGVATGMYYTPMGGDIMFVEASTMRGKGELVLTGQLGDVMKESARAAWTYARSHAAGLHITDDMFDRDVHIHVPAGAIPEGWPVGRRHHGHGAGLGALGPPGAARHRHDRRDHPAGPGAADRRREGEGAGRGAGGHHQDHPAEGERARPRGPAQGSREKLEVHLVDELGEVLALTLRGASFREGRLLFGDENPKDVTPLSMGYHH